MGERGPAPKPTQLRLLHGEKRPSQINANEPVPRAAEPECPAVLTGRAVEVWDETVIELRAMRLLHSSDTHTLAAYCQAVAHHEEAIALVNRSGMLVRGRLGEVVKNPAMQFVRDQAVLIKMYAGQFGLTPSARVSLSGEPADVSDAERLLS